MANKPGQKQSQQGQKPKLIIAGTMSAAIVTITGKQDTDYAFVLGTTAHPFQDYLTDPSGAGYFVKTDNNGLYKQPNGTSINLTLCPSLGKFQTISVIKVGEPGSISDPIELSMLAPAATTPSPFTAPGAPKPVIVLTCSNPNRGFGYHRFNFTVKSEGGTPKPYRICTSGSGDYFDRSGAAFVAAGRTAQNVTSWEVTPASDIDQFSVAFRYPLYSLTVWVELIGSSDSSARITVETSTSI